MPVIPGRPGRDLCDGLTRRELLRVGGSAAFGISLANVFACQEATAANPTPEGVVYGGPGYYGGGGYYGGYYNSPPQYGGYNTGQQW